MPIREIDETGRERLVYTDEDLIPYQRKGLAAVAGEPTPSPLPTPQVFSEEITSGLFQTFESLVEKADTAKYIRTSEMYRGLADTVAGMIREAAGQRELRAGLPSVIAERGAATKERDIMAGLRAIEAAEFPATAKAEREHKEALTTFYRDYAGGRDISMDREKQKTIDTMNRDITELEKKSKTLHATYQIEAARAVDAQIRALRRRRDTLLGQPAARADRPKPAF